MEYYQRKMNEFLKAINEKKSRIKELDAYNSFLQRKFDDIAIKSNRTIYELEYRIMVLEEKLKKKPEWDATFMMKELCIQPSLLFLPWLWLIHFEDPNFVISENLLINAWLNQIILLLIFINIKVTG